MHLDQFLDRRIHLLVLVAAIPGAPVLIGRIVCTEVRLVLEIGVGLLAPVDGALKFVLMNLSAILLGNRSRCHELTISADRARPLRVLRILDPIFDALLAVQLVAFAALGWIFYERHALNAL